MKKSVVTFIIGLFNSPFNIKLLSNKQLISNIFISYHLVSERLNVKKINNVGGKHKLIYSFNFNPNFLFNILYTYLLIN